MPVLPDEIRELLEGPNYIHLATLMADGAPHVVTIWGGLERHEDGDVIVFFTGSPQALKARNIARDPRVAISVAAQDDPYRTAWIRGRVVETRVDDLDTMQGLSRTYTGQAFPMQSNRVFVVEPERWRFSQLPFRHAPGARS
jgi:PPOX class probable F420-dependent enzyme